MTRRKKPRRVFSRCLVELPVGFRSLSRPDEPSEYAKGHTVDLCEGGVLIRCDGLEAGFLEELVEHEALFALRIQKSGDREWVKAVAKVVFIEGTNSEMLIRACFVELDELSQRKIHGVVEAGNVERSSLS